MRKYMWSCTEFVVTRFWRFSIHCRWGLTEKRIIRWEPDWWCDFVLGAENTFRPSSLCWANRQKGVTTNSVHDPVLLRNAWLIFSIHYRPARRLIFLTWRHEKVFFFSNSALHSNTKVAVSPHFMKRSQFFQASLKRFGGSKKTKKQKKNKTKKPPKNSSLKSSVQPLLFLREPFLWTGKPKKRLLREAFFYIVF